MPRLTEEKVRKILGDFINFDSEVMKRPAISNFIINNAIRFFNEVPENQRTFDNFKKELTNKAGVGQSGYKSDPTWLTEIIKQAKKSNSESADNVLKDIFDESKDSVKGYTAEEINNKFKDYGLPPMNEWTASNGLLSGVVSGRSDVSPRIIDYFNNTDKPTVEGLINSFGSGTDRLRSKINGSLASKGRNISELDNDISLMRAGSRDERAELRKQREALASEEAKKKSEQLARAEARKREKETAAKIAEIKAAEDARSPIDTSTPEGLLKEAARDKAILENVSMRDTLKEDLKRAEENQAKRKAAEIEARKANEEMSNLKKAQPGLTVDQIRDLDTKINAGEATATQNLPAFHQEALKGLYRGAVKDIFNRPYEPYRGERFAQETPLQVIAKSKLLELDPFLGETKENQQRIIDKIMALNPNVAKEAAKEYLMPSGQTLGQTHEDLIGAEERAAEDVYRRRGLEHLTENVLPAIHNKYSPSSHIHGSRDRELTKAIRNYGREIEDALSGMRLKNKAITVPAALEHQNQRIKSGQVASNSAISDKQSDMAAIEGLQKAQDETVKSKEKFINSIHGAGQAEQAREQQKNDLAYERFKEERDQGVSNIERFSNIIRGHNLPTAATQTNLLPPKFVPSNYSAAGELMAARGAGSYPQAAFKKGGVVKKAIGGSISPIQEAINWSVIDKESPIDEMKRNIRRQQALNMMGQIRNTRQMYAEGGSISPIEKGAMTADNVAYMDRVKKARENMMNQNMRDQTYQPQPFLTDLMSTGSRAISQLNKKRDNFNGTRLSGALEDIMDVTANVFDQKDKEREAFQKQRQGALDRDLNLLKDEEAIVRDARDFGFKEKELTERLGFERAKHADDIALRKLIQKSNETHQRKQEEFWKAKASEKKPRTEVQQKALDRAKTGINLWSSALDQLNHTYNLYEGALTNQEIGAATKNPWLLKTYGAAALANAATANDKNYRNMSAKDYQNMEAGSDLLVTKLKGARIASGGEGNKTTNMALQLDIASKLAPSVTTEENKARYESTAKDIIKNTLLDVDKAIARAESKDEVEEIISSADITPSEYLEYKKNPNKIINMLKERNEQRRLLLKNGSNDLVKSNNEEGNLISQLDKEYGNNEDAMRADLERIERNRRARNVS